MRSPERIIAISLLLIILTVPVFAVSRASLSFDGAFAGSSVITSTGYRTNTAYQMKAGWGVNLSLDLNFNKYVALEFGAKYITKGYNYYHTYSSYSVDDKYTFDFVEVPLLVVGTFPIKKFTLTAGLGTYVGYLISGGLKGSSTGVEYTSSGALGVLSYSESLDLDKYNRFVYGIIAQVGASYEISRMLDVFLAIRYEIQINATEKEYQADQTMAYNSSVMGALGLRVKFGKVL